MSAACHAKKHPSPYSLRVENERAPQVVKRPTTFHRISAASTTRAVYTPVKAGKRKEKVGHFRREVERFSFLLPHFHRSVARFVFASCPRVYALSEFSDFCLHRSTLSFQFVDFQCVVGEGFTFRCFCYITL